MKNFKLREYAQYVIGKFNNDIAMAKKVVANSAQISHAEGDAHAFRRETELFQEIEVIALEVKE